MYGTRNCKKKTTMRGNSNLSSSEVTSIKNRKIPQKIPLTEVTGTLRPRRGCKKNLNENNCKENNVPGNKANSKAREIRKGTFLIVSRNENNVFQDLPILKENTKNLKENNTKKGILQSIQNLKSQNNKSNFAFNNDKKDKTRFKSLKRNGGKTDKIIAPIKATQENSIMRKFPKWISDGVESLRRGKKRANLDVYDIETDIDFVLEKKLTKEVIVKKAKITKTKNYPTKQVRNPKTLSNNKSKSKEVAKKSSAKVCSDSCSGFTSQNHLADNAINLDSEKPSAIKPVIINKETVRVIQLDNCNKQTATGSEEMFKTEKVNVSCSINDDNKVGKSVEEPETPDKCAQFQFLHSIGELESSLNPQYFPVPQSSSTPQNTNKENISAQMLCDGFDVTMLEIPHIVPQDAQVDFSDSEFLSPEKAASDADEIQLFVSPCSNKDKRDKAPKKPSVVKNLNGLLNIEKPKQVKSDALKSDQLLLLDFSFQKAFNSWNFIKENEIMKSPSKQANLTSAAVTTSDLMSDLATNQVKQKKPSEHPEQIKKNTPRPKRACQQNKPVVDGSSDIELSFENDSVVQEVTLFETPEKKEGSSLTEEPLECAQTKAVLKSLFPEEWKTSPVKVVDVEEKVLKPRKSYHSPAQFRRHLVKAKKENKVQKKKQTKQDLLIESLNNHFSELDNMELCIE